MQVIVDDIRVVLLHQLSDTAKRPAPDGLLGDEPKSALHLVEPARVSRREVQIYTSRFDRSK